MRLARSFIALFLLLGLAPVTVPAAAAAPGLGLRWTDCFGDGGQQNRTFACNSNFGGSDLLMLSFVPASDLSPVVQLEVVLDMTAASAALPAWWEYYNVGSCRQSGVTLFGFQPLPGTACPDWAGGEGGGVNIAAYQVGISGPNTARLRAVTTDGLASQATLAGGSEYFALRLDVNHQKTAGSGACAGCLTPICIAFSSLKLIMHPQSGLPPSFLTGRINATDSDYATWQGGGVPGGSAGCSAATPTRRTTWGAVRSMYR
jgi:hypothetical protein